MRKRTLGLFGCLAVVASLAATPAAGAAPAAGAVPAAGIKTPQLVILQGLQFAARGIPSQTVDIYLGQDGAIVSEFPNISLGQAIDVNTALPGFVKPGFFVVDIVKRGGDPNHPLLVTAFALHQGDSKTIAAYFAADSAGQQGAPTLRIFTNNVAPTNGQARLSVYHLAVAPTVGVYADRTVAIAPSFSNGQSATVQVPAATYGVTVTAPKTPGTVLFKVGNVKLAPNTLTIAFAYGFYPKQFGVAAIAVPVQP